VGHSRLFGDEYLSIHESVQVTPKSVRKRETALERIMFSDRLPEAFGFSPSP
jgi:hypothetical protein